MEKVSSNQKSKIKIDNFEDMQSALNSMPELRKESGNASKHVNLTSALTKDINERDLLRLSILEQDIATKDNKNDVFDELMKIIKDPVVRFYDKLRLLLIFGLRYEGDSKVTD